MRGFQALSWQPLFGTLDQMPLSWVLPRRHLAQWSEKSIRECNSISSDLCRLTDWTERGKSRESLSGKRDVRSDAGSLGLRGSLLDYWLVQVLWALRRWNPKEHSLWGDHPPCDGGWCRIRRGHCKVTAHSMWKQGGEGGPPCLLVSNSADAEGNAQYLKNFLIFFRILSNQSTNIFFFFSSHKVLS